jgi:hypothetical protein
MDRSSQAIRIQAQQLKKGMRILVDPCVDQRCTNTGCQIAQETLLTVSPNIRGSSVQNLLFVSHGAPRILRSPLDFCKISAGVVCTEIENLQTGVIELNTWLGYGRRGVWSAKCLQVLMRRLSLWKHSLGTTHLPKKMWKVKIRMGFRDTLRMGDLRNWLGATFNVRFLCYRRNVGFFFDRV